MELRLSSLEVPLPPEPTQQHHIDQGFSSSHLSSRHLPLTPVPQCTLLVFLIFQDPNIVVVQNSVLRWLFFFSFSLGAGYNILGPSCPHPSFLKQLGLTLVNSDLVFTLEYFLTPNTTSPPWSTLYQQITVTLKYLPNWLTFYIHCLQPGPDN